MVATRYAIEDEPNPADVRALEDGLYRYNVEKTTRDDGRWLRRGSMNASATRSSAWSTRCPPVTSTTSS